MVASVMQGAAEATEKPAAEQPEKRGKSWWQAALSKIQSGSFDGSTKEWKIGGHLRVHLVKRESDKVARAAGAAAAAASMTAATAPTSSV